MSIIGCYTETFVTRFKWCSPTNGFWKLVRTCTRHWIYSRNKQCVKKITCTKFMKLCRKFLKFSCKTIHTRDCHQRILLSASAAAECWAQPCAWDRQSFCVFLFGGVLLVFSLGALKAANEHSALCASPHYISMLCCISHIVCLHWSDLWLILYTWFGFWSLKCCSMVGYNIWHL